MCESECVSVSVLLGCLAQESLGEGGCAGLAGSGSMPRDDPIWEGQAGGARRAARGWRAAPGAHGINRTEELV